MANYVYRMDHDTGFAPKIKDGVCTLSGCKSQAKNGRRNIEELAEKGSWVIGIGGNNTAKPNMLIYAMEVEENILYSKFKKRDPRHYSPSEEPKSENHVLVSKKFYYFKDNALELSDTLRGIIIRGPWFKYVSDEDIDKLKKFLSERYKHYGVFGEPNNPRASKKCGKC
ncbi:unnamed protein product [marine sediment metagenome]|uniref:Nucleotide modification associated domain-containing protein n=1 Tax=marine sediment metagenome TaxID=412755 RepID=X1ENC7_9ZZZZ